MSANRCRTRPPIAPQVWPRTNESLKVVKEGRQWASPEGHLDLLTEGVEGGKMELEREILKEMKAMKWKTCPKGTSTSIADVKYDSYSWPGMFQSDDYPAALWDQRALDKLIRAGKSENRLENWYPSCEVPETLAKHEHILRIVASYEGGAQRRPVCIHVKMTRGRISPYVVARSRVTVPSRFGCGGISGATIDDKKTASCDVNTPEGVKNRKAGECKWKTCRTANQNNLRELSDIVARRAMNTLRIKYAKLQLAQKDLIFPPPPAPTNSTSVAAAVAGAVAAAVAKGPVARQVASALASAAAEAATGPVTKVAKAFEPFFQGQHKILNTPK